MDHIVLKKGQRVRVTRQIGKHGTPVEVTGTIERFSTMIHVDGEQTALIAYDDGQEPYYHPISKVVPIEPASLS